MTPERSESIKPIRPEETISRREQLFPPQVIESFNKLIAQNCVKGESRFLREDIISLMVENGLNEREILEKHWLDVEEIYENNGWNVKYKGPDNDDHLKPYYTFSFSTK